MTPLPAAAEVAAEEIAGRLAGAAPGQVRIDDHPGTAAHAGPLTPAAVLVPIVASAAPTVLLTLRGRHLRAHAGQVAFPGGRVEATDTGPVAAALREAEEEIGLSQASVRVLGCLADHVTGTGFRVSPVVALVDPPLALRPDPGEVEEVFELPLATLLSPGAVAWREETLLGRRRRVLVVRHDRHLIWGATAAILAALGAALGAPRPV